MAKKKILIIDDEEDIAYLVETKLKFENYDVVCLYTGIGAMEIVKTEKPDLILLDVMMPEKSGYEVCKELKSDEELRGIPVILFTAKPEAKRGLEEGFKSVGADDYCFKDFDLSEMVTKIKVLLKE